MNALLFSLLLGSVGGNAAGLVLRNLNLGLFRNTVIGAFGGFIGHSIISDLQAQLSTFAIVCVAALGGIILTAIVGAVMNLRAR